MTTKLKRVETLILALDDGDGVIKITSECLKDILYKEIKTALEQRDAEVREMVEDVVTWYNTNNPIPEAYSSLPTDEYEKLKIIVVNTKKEIEERILTQLNNNK